MFKNVRLERKVLKYDANYTVCIFQLTNGSALMKFLIFDAFFTFIRFLGVSIHRNLLLTKTDSSTV